MKEWIRKLLERSKRSLTEEELNNFQEQYNALIKYCSYDTQAKSFGKSSERKTWKKRMAGVMTELVQFPITKEFLHWKIMELEKLHFLQIVSIAICTPTEDKARLVKLEALKKEIEGTEKFDEEKILYFKKSIQVFVSVITQEEKLMVIKALGLQQGHWFKCPNGHLYAIGECGGAMQEGKCIECNATVGGQSHTLRPDNKHAPEMDGSSHPAWNDLNNLQNFDPNQFM